MKKYISLLLALLLTFSFILPGFIFETEAAATLTWPVPGHTSLSRGFSSGHPAIDICDGSINGATVIAAMGGTDAIVFTGGIGENTPKIRAGALEGLEFLGIELNKEINAGTKGSAGVTKLSTDDSKVAVYMIPTNEELVIAQDTEALVKAL